MHKKLNNQKTYYTTTFTIYEIKRQISDPYFNLKLNKPDKTTFITIFLIYRSFITKYRHKIAI